MDVIKRGKTPDGIDIQIENWHKDYPDVFPEADTLAAYPVSKWNIPGAFAPKGGEKFRAEFRFANKDECAAAFEAISSGEKTLADYVDRLWEKRYTPAILGYEKETSE